MDGTCTKFDAGEPFTREKLAAALAKLQEIALPHDPFFLLPESPEARKLEAEHPGRVFVHAAIVSPLQIERKQWDWWCYRNRWGQV